MAYQKTSQKAMGVRRPGKTICYVIISNILCIGIWHNLEWRPPFWLKVVRVRVRLYKNNDKIFFKIDFYFLIINT